MRYFCISGLLRHPDRLIPLMAACLVVATQLPGSAFAQDDSAPADTARAPDDQAPAAEVPLTRLETQIEFRRLMTAEDYAAAVPFAERLLEIALEEHGTRSVETGRALFELGDVQRRAGLLEEAELSLLNSIEVFRAAEGQFSPLTIEPSIGLGDTYYDDRQYRNAVSAYNEARTTQRRAYGLLSEDQLIVIDRMSRTFQAMALNEEADEQQRMALTLVERIYGPADVETLEAMYRYAAWLRSVYRYEEERQQYERAIRLIRAEYDKDHPLLARPYREIGNSFRTQGFESPRGASALNSAVELLEEQPSASPRDLAETLVDLADWRTAFNPPGSGHEHYLRAWNLLGSIPDNRARRVELFVSGRAIAVFSQSMSIRGLASNPSDPDAVDGHVLIEFDIDPYGRPENVSVRESDPPGFKDDAAARSVRLSRFRPRIENGEFVYARRQGYLISFRYMPDDG